MVVFFGKDANMNLVTTWEIVSNNFIISLLCNNKDFKCCVVKFYLYRSSSSWRKYFKSIKNDGFEYDPLIVSKIVQKKTAVFTV